MSHKLCLVAIFLGGLALSAPLAKGQDVSSRPQKPIPPVGSEEESSGARQAGEGADAPKEAVMVSDSRPLSGAQSQTLGAIAFNHMSLQPSFSIVSQAEKYPNSSGFANGQDVLYTNYLTGRLGLNRTSGRSELLVDYLAGGTLTNNSALGISAIQNLEFSDTIRWGRWSQLFGDQFSYLSESPFGFGGVGGLGFLGAGLGNGLGGIIGSSPAFRADLLPNQSILTNHAPRISNAAIVQTDYELSRSSSLTFVGSYGILRFIDAGLQDGSNVLLQAGYNHTLSRRDSVSVHYRFNEFMFSNISQRIDDHTVQLTYGRKVTGRLSFQVGAGPQIDTFETPLTGSSSVFNWTASSELKYRVGRTTAGFTFDHALTGGSGILLGAETNQFQGSLSRNFHSVWDGTIALGYAMNQALRQTTPGANTISPNAWFATAQVSRRFARNNSLFFTYSAREQSSITSARLHSMTHMISVGYTWGFRPIVIE